MSLSTPQSITIDAVAIDFHRIKDDGLSSEYRSDDGLKVLKVSHQENATRTRRMMRLDATKTSSDPISGDAVQKSTSIYLVVDEPDFGFTDTEIDDLYDGLATWITANLAAVLTSRH